MWLLIIVSNLLSASAFESAPQSATQILRKCCPKEQSLIKVTEKITDHRVRYECADGENAKINYNLQHFSVVMANNITVKYGFPKNCETNYSYFAEIGEEIVNVNGTCYDNLVCEIENGTVVRNIPETVSLKCKSESYEQNYESKLKVNPLRKCCLKGQAYDVQYHLCRDDEEELAHDHWLRLVSQISGGESYVYDVNHAFHCKADEYSVELSENNFALEIYGRTLKYSGKKGNGEVHQDEWCVDRLFGSKNLVSKVCTRDCVPYGAFCFRKCCPLGENYKPFHCNSYRSRCVPTTKSAMYFNSSYFLDPLRHGDDDDLLDVQGLRIGLKCNKGKFALNRSLPTDENWLRRDGLLYGPVTALDHENYCIELFDWRSCAHKIPFEETALVCILNRIIDDKNFFFAAVTNSISAVGLAITLVVYCALPELRNLHGRTIICHVSTMLLAYTCLARVQFQNVKEDALCKALGYGIYFGFVSAFVWLNVMCYDIWSTFGSMKSVQVMRKANAERRRFIWYSMYAWSLALLLTLVMYLLDTFPVADFLKANMGNKVCWFGAEQNSTTDWPHYVFFVIPIGVLTSVNLVLWLLTVRHCVRVKSEVHRLQAGSVGDRAKKCFRVDRANFILTGKLWVVMGAGWIAELLSTLVNEPPWLWTTIDLVSQLQGVIIFLILVLKPKIYYLIRKRLGLEKPDAQKHGTSSGRTSTTFLSRTISSDERTHLRISLPNNDVKRT